MTSGPALLVAGAAGLALGSFAVTAGARLGRGEGLGGRSRCDGCARTLGWLETLPLASYAAARGACRACRAPITRLHPAGEAAGAAVVLTSLLVADPLRAAFLAGLGLLLVALSAVDWTSRRLPDPLTAGAGVLGLALAVHGGANLMVNGAVAAATVAILLGVRAVAGRAGRDPGLGLGDVKLLAALALWLGPIMPWAVVAAAFLGLIGMAAVRPADGRLPFGPFIASGAWLVGLAGEAGAWLTTM